MSFLSQPRYSLDRIFLAGIFACLLTSTAIAGRIFAQERAPARVRVRVGDERENAIATADVRLHEFGHGDFSHRGFTDAAGTIEFPNVGRGAYILEVLAPGYQNFQEHIDVDGGMTQTYSVILKPEPNRSSSTPTGPGGTISTAALSVPQSAQKEFQEGLKRLQENDPAKGAEHFATAIQEYPKYAEAYAWLSLAYMEEKQNADAERAAKKAIAIDAKLSLAHTVLGKLFLQERSFQQAESELLLSVQLAPQAWDALFELSRCYFNMSQLDKSLQYARQASAAPQAASITHLLLADIYLRQENKQNALKELQAFTKQDPQSPLIPRVKQKIEQLSKIN